MRIALLTFRVLFIGEHRSEAAVTEAYAARHATSATAEGASA
jgi:hypothetical protein